MSGFNDVVIYVPAKNEMVIISEGTGDNLLKEDISAGYVDYVNYDTYAAEIDLPPQDGGMLLTNQLVREKYASLEEAVPDVLNMAYNDRTLKYIVLKEAA